MRNPILGVVVAFVVAWAAGAADPVPEKKPEYTVSEIMMKAHHPGRQLNRALDQVVISGRATDAEKKRLVELYEALSRATPPAGTVESWKKDTGAIVKAAQSLADGDDKAAGALLHAINCAACHEKYRTPALIKDSPASPAQKKVREILDKGGEHWSAPTRASIDGQEYLQPGWRLYVWPAEDRVYRAAKSGDQYYVRVPMRWALQPGGSLPGQAADSYQYKYGSVTKPGNGSWNMMKAFDPKAAEGTFESELWVGAQKQTGEEEYTFVLLSNATVAVPIANFVRITVKCSQ
jgi:hypothetical protein